MLPDTLIFGIGAALSASCFLAPLLFRPANPHKGWIITGALYIVAFACLQVIVDMHTAFAAVLLGLVFTVLGKVLAINFRMVQSTNYPKHRRCY